MKKAKNKIDKFYLHSILFLFFKLGLYFIISELFFKNVTIFQGEYLWRRAAIYSLLFMFFTLTTTEESRKTITHMINALCSVCFYLKMVVAYLNVRAGVFILAVCFAVITISGTFFKRFLRMCNTSNKIRFFDYWIVIYNKVKIYLIFAIAIAVIIVPYYVMPRMTEIKPELRPYISFTKDKEFDYSEYDISKQHEVLTKMHKKHGAS